MVAATFGSFAVRHLMHQSYSEAAPLVGVLAAAYFASLVYTLQVAEIFYTKKMVKLDFDHLHYFIRGESPFDYAAGATIRRGGGCLRAASWRPGQYYDGLLAGAAHLRFAIGVANGISRGPRYACCLLDHNAQTSSQRDV